MKRRQSDDEPEPLLVDPTPFNVYEHGSRYRRSRRDNCREQNILFVLDTSGSIGQSTFNRVTALLGDLVPLFCKPIRVAAMTFNRQPFSEFCFNDYDNSAYGRGQTGAAMRSIHYRGGSTFTAEAARYACNHMLSSTCGLPIDAGCIDVIFLTDGRANDPSLDICTEIQCLHNRIDVDTFAIGVGNYDTLRLGCYGENDLDLGEYHIFDFANFTQLEQELLIVKQKLLDTALFGGEYNCTSPGVDPEER